jgi:hypothetical protein
MSIRFGAMEAGSSDPAAPIRSPDARKHDVRGGMIVRVC